MKEFLKANAVFGIGSCLIGLLITVLDRYIPSDNALLHWVIIAAILLALSALLIVGVYMFRRRKSIAVKADKEKACNLLLENIELIKKIGGAYTDDEQKVFVHKLLHNLKMVKAYYWEHCETASADIFIIETKKQIEFLHTQTELLGDSGKTELELIENDLRAAHAQI